VVVDDFDILGSSFRPAEANAPLVVDSDAELTEAISLEGLQSIAARGRQIGKGHGSIQPAQTT
jgi:hypothetical protein